MTIGITGGIGSGKSTIARELAKRGFAIYDCDQEAKRIIAKNTEVQQAIVDLLGSEAFVNGHYNTAYVAQRVFEKNELLSALNHIVHPAIKKDLTTKWSNSANGLTSNSETVFIESAILFEAGMDTLCDKIVIVDAPEEIRIARTIARDYQGKATPENINKVRARIRAQKTSAEVSPRRPMLIVHNDGQSVLSGIVDLVCDFATH